MKKTAILIFLFIYAFAKSQSVSFIAVGDNLIHSKIIEAGYIESNKTYIFDDLYANFSEKIASTDIKIINQETILIKDSKKYSGYPNFGSPFEIGEAVKKAGFNIISHATNHTLDKGEDGILDSIEFYSKFDDIALLGIHNSQDDSEMISIVKKNGVKIAFLNYTYGLNGHKMPKDKEYLVDLLDDSDKIVRSLKSAKKNADFIVVLPHWGIEYTHTPTKSQKDMAKFFADNGADMIIGTHSHVIQPLEFIASDDNRSVPCFYSLGNFISNQDQPVRMLGAMAKFEIIKDENTTWIKNIEAVPIITHIQRYSQDFSVYFLQDYPVILEQTHRLRRFFGKEMSVEKLKSIWNSVFTNFQI